MNPVHVGKIEIGAGRPLVLIAGPCVVEEEPVMRRIAAELRDLCGELGVPLVFKSSYIKDNRTDGRAFRGPGLDQGLALLGALGSELDLPLVSDVHRVAEVSEASRVLDMLQVPAYLCKQTSLLEAAAGSGRPVNIKKGQFMSPLAIRGSVDKVRRAGCEAVLLTERGSCFGYDRLVCDMTAVPLMQGLGCPVAFDAGHATPERSLIGLLARCGVAAGADALFVECHPDPAAALCDGRRMLSVSEMRRLLREILPLAAQVREAAASRPVVLPSL